MTSAIILSLFLLIKVCVLNFHSHYRNNKKQVIEDKLLNQVNIITVPIDYYSLPANEADNVSEPHHFGIVFQLPILKPKTFSQICLKCTKLQEDFCSESAQTFYIT